MQYIERRAGQNEKKQKQLLCGRKNILVRRGAAFVLLIRLFQAFAHFNRSGAYTYRPFMFAVPMLILFID